VVVVVVVVVVVEVSEAVPVLTFSSDAVSPKSALSVWEDSGIYGAI
jgi:hypothetical protein